MKKRIVTRSLLLELVQWGTAFAVIVAVLISCRWFAKSQPVYWFDVFLDDQHVGTVSDPEIVKQWKAARYEEVGQQYDHARVTSNLEQLRFVRFDGNKTFQGAYDNDAVIAALNDKLVFAFFATEIRIDGTPVGIVKDVFTAAALLDQVKAPFLNVSKEVAILSEAGAGNRPKVKMTAEFTQEVQLLEAAVAPGKVEPAEAVLNRILSGAAQPLTYTVQKGDCISLIAQRFQVAADVIRANNPEIKKDLIRVGQTLKLSVNQPLLSVKTIETHTEEIRIASGIVYEKDSELQAGVIQIVANGKPGWKQVTYESVRVNGEPASQSVVDETILELPVRTVVRQGTKVIPGVGTGKFALPVLQPKVTSEFGLRWGKNHNGTDFVSEQKAIMAADHGKVTFAGWKSGYGNCIVIDHQNGYETLYGHLSKVVAREGDGVKKGDKIGVMGSTGNSTGVHLHFEIIKNGQQQNPLQYLSV
ncbi:Murein DD-endopeptidase MepM and murein hydrolase activator NlpD, contain LysM domain [Paenibacillus tianmuensis]|uniref:Murein DD-endopeptidase MepM and murein hydrolase activator NlpD, contain LysM domain n=1 Tax=Paenibacillus tianmuensis TaxID=624147 RepID=A0A1G4P866_9BACL|nr:M23 family metallopeptidase [Paenibacillus tianmuensis]SCW28374.1 Murein DD-endopeptidase MepM and murein hydrolase activator NlpD, contain LysM domain [Paenibacillus tianmuensis]